MHERKRGRPGSASASASPASSSPASSSPSRSPARTKRGKAGAHATKRQHKGDQPDDSSRRGKQSSSESVPARRISGNDRDKSRVTVSSRARAERRSKRQRRSRSRSRSRNGARDSRGGRDRERDRRRGTTSRSGARNGADTELNRASASEARRNEGTADGPVEGGSESALRQSKRAIAGRAGVDGANTGSEQSVKAGANAENKAAAGPKANILVDQPATVTGRTGGVYIPPFKLAQMQKDASAMGKATKEYQRIAWEALRKSINGLINKVNTTNIKMIAPELFQLNLVRGRGLFARAVMKAQLASPGFTPVFAALVAVINTKLPENGELILKRVIVAFRRAYKRRDKIVATGLAKFIAHLVNQQVAHELLALQLLTVLLEEPTDDSVEIAVNFTKEIGQVLQELSPQGLHAVFERFRGILHEGQIDKRVQYTIETLFAVRKSGFSDHPAVPPELDLVERNDQITFEIGLEDKLDKEEMLDIFRVDEKFEENEEMWSKIKGEILGESDSDSNDDGDEDGNDDDSDEDEGQATGPTHDQMTQQIHDLTEQDLVNLRRTIYLTIMSSAGFEECAHKLMKLDIQEGYEMELCNMMIECCSQERTWLPYYGLIGQRFCMIHRRWQGAFNECFETNYNTIHRLETNKLRNVAKFFAHLLYTDALPWTCLEVIRLSEDATTSSSRIFIKILVLELSENMGLKNLRERFNDPYMAEVFQGMFPTDNPRNTRFAINFFTAIGLGGLTDGLRLHLKNAPKMIMQAQMAAAAEEDSSSTSSSTSSSSSSSSGSSSTSGSDTSSSSDSDSSSDSS